MNNKLVEVFAKTKILCTLGPSTQTADCIKKLMLAGVDGVRLNFSHGNYNFFESIFNEIHKACTEEETPLAVVIDLQGPKIRIGELNKPEIELLENDIIEITIEDIVGNENIISTSYKSLPQDAELGNLILLDDGLIKLKVIKKKNNSVVCSVQAGGILKPKKGMNLPGMKLSTEAFTEKDRRDILFALKHRIDFIALSFVRSANDVVMLSGETSVGKFPVETVKMMNDIIRNAEEKISNYHEYVFEIPKNIEDNLFDSVGRAMKNISDQIKANAIVAFTIEGRTARNLSKFRPKAKIISFTNKFETMNNLCLYWGVTSVFFEEIDKEHMAIEEAKKRIKDSGHLNTGDLLIFTAGAPYSEKSRANWMRFEII